MNFIENVKNGVTAAVGTISDAAQGLMEKNRTNARINRLKFVIKNESAILNKAYIHLGKIYYENPETERTEEIESICEIITNSKLRLKMAQNLYREIIEQQNAAQADAPAAAEEFVDTITVACSNEDDCADAALEQAADAAEICEDGGESEPEPVSEPEDIVIAEAEIADEQAEACSDEAAEEISEEAADENHDAF